MSPVSPHSGLPTADEEHQWAVVHCRPRCEKKVAEYCSSKAFGCYLPLLVKKHRYGNRLRTHATPVFAGYLFALTDASGRSHLRQHQRVANVLDVVDQQQLVRQLEQIKLALESDQPAELLPRLAVGMKVMVQAGPLKGVEGIVEKVKNKSRIILNVDFIQQSLAIEVDSQWLLPV